jgi:hypothetical protein
MDHLAAECSRDKHSKKTHKQPVAISSPSISVEIIETVPLMEQSATSDKDRVPEEFMPGSIANLDMTTLLQH